MGSPSKRGLQDCAGGVTGAVPHMVKKNSGSIISLFIILLYHNHWCDNSMKLTKVFLTILCILAFFLFSHLKPEMVVSHYVVYHNCYRNQQYDNHPYNTPDYHIIDPKIHSLLNTGSPSMSSCNPSASTKRSSSASFRQCCQ